MVDSDNNIAELATYEVDRDLVQSYLKGRSQSDLARELGISRERVRQRLKRNGFGGRNYRWVPDLETLLAVLAKSDSLDETARQLGLNRLQLRTTVAHHRAAGALEDAQERWRTEWRNARMFARQQFLLKPIHDLALKVGHTPSQGELQDIGISHVELNRVFGSVSEAMRRAGLIPNQAGRPPMALPDDVRDLYSASADEGEVGRRAELIRRLGGLRAEPEGSECPVSVSLSTSAYKRDPKVVAWILQTADGVCELCGVEGYETDRGLAYLEVHHMLPLSAGGPDIVSNAIAVCETCHGKLHRWKHRAELETSIYAKIHRLRRPSTSPGNV